MFQMSIHQDLVVPIGYSLSFVAPMCPLSFCIIVLSTAAWHRLVQFSNIDIMLCSLAFVSQRRVSRSMEISCEMFSWYGLPLGDFCCSVSMNLLTWSCTFSMEPSAFCDDWMTFWSIAGSPWIGSLIIVISFVICYRVVCTCELVFRIFGKL